MSEVIFRDDHEHTWNDDGLCPCGAYRGFSKKKIRRNNHEDLGSKLVTIIQCQSCNGKGKNTRGCRCIECNGTGKVQCKA